MLYKNILKVLKLSLLCLGVFCACSKDDDDKKHDLKTYLSSQIVANGDYLTTNVYGYSDFDFQVKYYWDGKLIQTTDKATGLKYLVNEAKDGSTPGRREDGDHILKVEFVGEAKGISTFYIQVYDREKGYLGCTLIPESREIRNGETLQGEMVFYPHTAKTGGWSGAISSIKVFIDNQTVPVQTIANAPFKFEIPIKGLSIGSHKLIIEVDGIYLSAASAGNVSTIYGTFPTTYTFTVVN